MFNKILSSHREYYMKVRLHKMTNEAIDFAEDFFLGKQALNRVTPTTIIELQPNQIFVFGSNEAGHHDGSAARFAVVHFGAIYGQGVGLQGQTMPSLQWG